MQSVKGSNIVGNIVNDGNVHTLYKVDYTLYDAKGNVIGTGTNSDTIVRNTTNPLKITTKVNNVAKAVVVLSYQDITTKTYGNATTYTVATQSK